jgi:hypothetical protein
VRGAQWLAVWATLLRSIPTPLPNAQAREHTSVGTALATAAAAAVKDAALAAGSTDNITVVALLFDWDGTLTSSDGTLTSIDGTLTSRDST